MKNKKIAFVIPALTIGGMERVMSQLVNFVAENYKEPEIHLILLTKSKIEFELHPEIKIHEPDFDYRNYSRLSFTLKSITYLRKKLKQIKPESALSFGDRYNSMFILCSLGLPVKSYVSNRQNPLLSNGRFIDAMNRIFYRFADGIIAQTQMAKDIFVKKYSNPRVFVIPNPIRPIKGASEVKHEERENIILNVGRFADQKCQHLLVRYFNKTGHKNWKIIFLGDGPKMEGEKKIMEQEGLLHLAEFHGSVSNVDDYYRRSKVFAFTSLTEGFPNSLGEAMAAKMACISFDCVAGPRELIDDEVNGYLVPMQDDDAYVSRLKNLLENEELQKQFAEAAHEKMKDFTLEKSFREYLNVMQVI